MEAVRLRLVFPNRRRILTNSNQSQEELKRSWFLLNPTLHQTIADVSSHIARIFNLTHSCPHGISLSMDGFVLPPFESTCILKDKDLIRVKRNEGGTSSGTVEVDGVDLIDGEDVMAKNLVGTDVLLLENGELEDKTGSHQNKVEEGEMNVVDLLPANHLAGENAGSKKRKTSKKLQKEKVKRKKEGIVGGIVGIDGVNLIEVEDVEKNPADPDDLLLTNGECDNGTLSYQNELEEGEVNVVDLLLVNQSAGKDAGSKKRKTTKKLRNAKTKRKGKTSTETTAVADDKKLTYGKDKTKEKQHLDTGVLRIANEEFEKDTNADQSELKEKEDNLLEGLLLVENSAVKEAVPKKRKASEELESTKKKKKQAGWLYRFFETDGQAEENGPCHSPNRKEKESLVARPETESDIHVGQNEPNQCSGMSSVMNVDEVEKVSNLESKHEKESAPASAEGNDKFIEPITTPKSVLHEHGTKSVNAPQASQGMKKVSRSTKRTYEKRKWRKELKAEAKELLAENVLIKDKHLPKKYIATSLVEDQQHNQHDVVRPRHIRFEVDEKDEDVQQSRVIVETCQTIGINSKRKNGKWGNEKYVYCTRSNCRASGGECLQVVTLEKPQNDPTEFNKLPLLTSCPKEGDVIAYRVLEQSPDLGPILSSFRVGKTLRLDNWSSTLLLTPVEENPVTSVESDNDAWEPHNPSNKESGAWEQLNPINKESGAWEQHNPIDKESGAWEQQHDSIDKERKHIEIDVASLYDVRIVKHAPVRVGSAGRDVDKWDSLSQVASLKNSLLSRKREWGKVGASTSSSKQEWGKVGPGTTSSKEWGKAGPAANSSAKDWGKVAPAMTSLSKQGWEKWGSTVTSSKQECGKAGPTTSSWSSKPFNNSKQEWCKVGPNTTSSNKEWSKVGPSTTSRKKEGSNASPTTSSWSSKPFNNTNKEWGKKGPSTSSWKKEGSNAGPIASSWSSRPFNNKKQSQNGHSKSKW